MSEMRRMTVACDGGVQASLVVEDEERAMGIVRSLEVARDEDDGFTQVRDMFGNLVALDASRVVAICTDRLDADEEGTALRRLAQLREEEEAR